MPLIEAYADHPTHPYVRVEINWADVPAADYAGAYRVDVETGECTPLRPYICYSGWELLLSCGTGIFWDTEAPFDRPFYYVTTSSGAPCIPDPDPCVPCVPVTADTSLTPITLASSDSFWLKDPVRPCHDQEVPLCTDTERHLRVPCTGSGILFVGITPEIYPSNSFSLRPMNRRRNLAVTRPRGDAVTALRLQTVTFADRDALLTLLAPGTPLLWQGPEAYGVPDRYMDIKDAQIISELPDLRIQVRSVVLPYDTVERPAGPTTGICGARVADICDGYRTWADLAATGLTWNDLVAGQASAVSANPDRRTWDDVDAEFVDWDAVAAGGRTWTGLLEGD